MIKSTYICHLGNQTSRRIQHVGFIVKTVCCSKKKLSKDLCSPCSRQLLQLQPFSQILKFGTSFFYFILPEIVWFPEIWHSSAINFDFFKTMEFVYFQSLTFALPMIFFITASCIPGIGSIKSSLHNAFSMTGLGLLKQFLSLDTKKYNAGNKVRK